jgi:hypothetical protein
MSGTYRSVSIAKVGVAGSNPVVRSKNPRRGAGVSPGAVRRWLGRCLLVRRRCRRAAQRARCAGGPLGPRRSDRAPRGRRPGPRVARLGVEPSGLEAHLHHGGVGQLRWRRDLHHRWPQPVPARSSCTRGSGNGRRGSSPSGAGRGRRLRRRRSHVRGDRAPELPAGREGRRDRGTAIRSESDGVVRGRWRARRSMPRHRSLTSEPPLGRGRYSTTTTTRTPAVSCTARPVPATSSPARWRRIG